MSRHNGLPGYDAWKTRSDFDGWASKNHSDEFETWAEAHQDDPQDDLCPCGRLFELCDYPMCEHGNWGER